MRALGDQRRSLVITPKGRTGFSLWVGAGLVDMLEVWADARRAFDVDSRATTLTGYSMGGISRHVPDRVAHARPLRRRVLDRPTGRRRRPESWRGAHEPARRAQAVRQPARGRPAPTDQGAPTTTRRRMDSRPRTRWPGAPSSPPVADLPGRQPPLPGAVHWWAGQRVDYHPRLPAAGPDSLRVVRPRHAVRARGRPRRAVRPDAVAGVGHDDGAFERLWMSERRRRTCAVSASVDARSPATTARLIYVWKARWRDAGTHAQTGLGWIAATRAAREPLHGNAHRCRRRAPGHQANAPGPTAAHHRARPYGQKADLRLSGYGAPGRRWSRTAAGFASAGIAPASSCACRRDAGDQRSRLSCVSTTAPRSSTITGSPLTCTGQRRSRRRVRPDVRRLHSDRADLGPRGRARGPGVRHGLRETGNKIGWAVDRQAGPARRPAADRRRRTSAALFWRSGRAGAVAALAQRNRKAHC